MGVALSLGSPSFGAGSPSEVARLVSPDYRHLLIQQLSVADDKAADWCAAIENAPEANRNAIAFLLVNMPADDLKSLSPARVFQEVALANETRSSTPWGKEIPDDLFLNDVLPYANTTEERDPWREDFHKQFAPVVKDCKSATEAAQLLNRTIFKATGVSYHATKRRKPDQSPAESMKIGFASCTGLSIMLVDACRSVGIPAHRRRSDVERQQRQSHVGRVLGRRLALHRRGRARAA
ncbi:MAG: transglutaminase domain-containing protein [Tepidisphaeraceae bacterium]